MAPRERPDTVSIYAELRAIAWLGVMLSKNLDRIGPIAICSAIGLISFDCYVGERTSRPQ